METSVLIVGAGPSGLVLALWLSHFDIPVRIIDKNTGPGTESRAIGIQARTLEFYQQMGFAQEIVNKGIKADALTIRKNGGETFSISLKEMGKGLSPFPFLLFFPQDEHEKILIEHLQQAGIIVERNTELLSFTQTQDGVKALLKTEKGTEPIEVAYLCGCDGARSTTRDLLHIQFPGGTYSQIFYVADVMPESETIDPNLQVCVSQEDFCLVLPVRSSGSLRLIGIVPHDKETKEKITFDDVIPSIVHNTLLKIKTLNWFSTYHVHHRVAEHFQKDRVFLIGDAAHIHSPAGAQGMNTGIGDAINLAWKIAEVIKNQAPSSLLDSYEIERMRFANRLVSTTDKLFQLMTNEGLLGKCWRDLFVPYVLPVLFRLALVRRYFFKIILQIQLNYRQSPLSKGHTKKISAGDRLPWVRSENNFAPLQSLNWQAHIYGEASLEFKNKLKELNIPLHVFPWNNQTAEASLEKNWVYLIRPDGYISYMTSDLQNLNLFFSSHHY